MRLARGTDRLSGEICATLSRPMFRGGAEQAERGDPNGFGFGEDHGASYEGLAAPDTARPCMVAVLNRKPPSRTLSPCHRVPTGQRIQESHDAASEQGGRAVNIGMKPFPVGVGGKISPLTHSEDHWRVICQLYPLAIPAPCENINPRPGGRCLGIDWAEVARKTYGNGRKFVGERWHGLP